MAAPLPCNSDLRSVLARRGQQLSPPFLRVDACGVYGNRGGLWISIFFLLLLAWPAQPLAAPEPEPSTSCDREPDHSLRDSITRSLFSVTPC